MIQASEMRQELPSALPISERAEFRSRREFEAFFHGRAGLCTDFCEQTIVAHCKRWGMGSHFFGRIPADQVSIIGTEPRDHLMGLRLNVRQRSLLDAVVEFLSFRTIPDHEAKIYGHEAMTPFALALRGRYPKFIGTEFTQTDEEKIDIFPIKHGDVCASEFPSDIFDVILSGDVLEHVPNIDEALRECARILKPAGMFIGTFPFLYWLDESVRRASIIDGKISHILTPPIYHGDPMRPEQGCLVFELPSWDILDRARYSGFSYAFIEFICDQDRGIVASYEGCELRPRGILIAKFVK